MYVEDLESGVNKDIGPKAFFKMACSHHFSAGPTDTVCQPQLLYIDQ